MMMRDGIVTNARRMHAPFGKTRKIREIWYRDFRDRMDRIWIISDAPPEMYFSHSLQKTYVFYRHF